MRPTSKLIVCAAFILGLCTCCSTIRVAHTSSVAKVDTVYIKEAQLVVDSVWRDHWHTVYTQGDTVYKLDSVIIERWRYVKGDTVRLETSFRDSLVVDTIYVEKRAQSAKNGWYSFCSGWTICSFVIIILALVYFVLRKVRIL